MQSNGQRDDMLKVRPVVDVWYSDMFHCSAETEPGRYDCNGGGGGGYIDTVKLTGMCHGASATNAAIATADIATDITDFKGYGTT